MSGSRGATNVHVGQSALTTAVTPSGSTARTLRRGAAHGEPVAEGDPDGQVAAGLVAIDQPRHEPGAFVEVDEGDRVAGLEVGAGRAVHGREGVDGAPTADLDEAERVGPPAGEAEGPRVVL